ncbi:MAG: LON peptidase substrate-binding domain-containing protein [Alphaproteobacteria bacterium]
MVGTPFDTRLDDLPAVVPVFPLSGVLLLPGGRLPLNVFESRYLTMVLDCLGAGRVIGMIQPLSVGGGGGGGGGASPSPAVGDLRSELYAFGCIGRVSSFSETDDGRLQITLAGVCRFRIARELDPHHGYRRVEADYADFRDDFESPAGPLVDRKRLLTALRPYFALHGITINWKAFDSFSDAAIVTTISMLCPFEPREKQALLESPTVEERGKLLIALIEMGILEAGGGAGSMRQ